MKGEIDNILSHPSLRSDHPRNYSHRALQRPKPPRALKRFFPSIGFAVLLCFLLAVPRSEAFDLLAELAAGYDSNPALGDPSDGSGFSNYALGADQFVSLSNDLSLDLSVAGRYQDYWSVGDNYRLQTGAALSYVMAEGRLLPSLVGEVAAYRDALIETDARNEAMVGVNADWILSNRLTLGFEQSFRWLGYLNWAKPFSGKGQGRNPDNQSQGGKNAAAASTSSFDLSGSPGNKGNGKGGGNGSGKGNRRLNTLYPPRNNLLMTTGVDLDVFILPQLTGRLYAAFGNLNSSLDMESFREIQAGAALSWVPAELWRTVFEATWYRTYYNSVPEDITRVRRTNYNWSAGMQISRFWGDFELFAQLGWKSGDAPLDYESYQQTVIQCGLSYTF
ncbi:MAG: hypothetical protein K9N10_13720 [Deltaproteobacteria bacterium]|nr:hypothetical protein [Deltaproteobacteria bacterium]